MSRTTARYHEPAPQENDAVALRRVIAGRRSVRKFTARPLPQEILDDCIDLALLAPNSSNLQPWAFYQVQSAAKKRALVDICLGQNAAASAAELIVVVARTDTWREHARLNLEHFPIQPIPKLVQQYYRMVVPLAYTQGPLSSAGHLRRRVSRLSSRFRPVPQGPCSREEMRLWACKSTALAAENLMLALRAHGFDSCPMEGFDERRLARLLELDAHALPIMVIAAGERAPDGVYYPQLRFERERFVFKV